MHEAMNLLREHLDRLTKAAAKAADDLDAFDCETDKIAVSRRQGSDFRLAQVNEMNSKAAEIKAAIALLENQLIPAADHA